jgi:Uma2 family endonuclease
MDLCYVTADVMARQDDDESTVVIGVPAMAVELRSPGTRDESHNAKLEAYKAAGVPLVWVLDPYPKTVLALRPGADPVLFAGRQELTAPDVLPGFRVVTAKLFR